MQSFGLSYVESLEKKIEEYEMVLKRLNDEAGKAQIREALLEEKDEEIEFKASVHKAKGNLSSDYYYLLVETEDGQGAGLSCSEHSYLRHLIGEEGCKKYYETGESSDIDDRRALDFFTSLVRKINS